MSFVYQTMMNNEGGIVDSILPGSHKPIDELDLSKFMILGSNGS